MNNLYDILTGIITLQEATIRKMSNFNSGGNNNGYTPVKGIDYWTEEDIQQIQEYINNNMPESGYTPVKGTDYWTNADKEQIKEYIENAILSGEW